MPNDRVTIPAFDPAVDALIIEVGDKEYHFVADMALFQDLANGDFQIDGDSPDLSQFWQLLHRGCVERHPELTVEDVQTWCPTLRQFIPLRDALQAYMNRIGEMAEETAVDGRGEAPVPAGSTSGRGRATTSASRRRK